MPNERPAAQPIGNYGLLADCNSAALVDRDGSIDWLCLPRFDSPAVFARLLGEDAGHWSIRPVGAYRSERRYLPDSLVLETTFRTDGGSVRLRDVMAFREGQRLHELGTESLHEVLRLVEGIEGTVELTMELAPRPEYGLVTPLFRETEDGGRTFGGPNQIDVRAGVPVTITDATMYASFRVARGETVGFALSWVPLGNVEPVTCPPQRVAARVEDSVKAWRSWDEAHDIYRGAYRHEVRLSSRVLKGLAYRPSGAIVAAPTTSLPETVGGERNWDYRYAWVRDASLTLEALYIGACSDEAERFISFITSSAGGHPHDPLPLQIMYGIGGEHDLSERELAHLSGWRGSKPVRVGNGAWTQTQLDVYGELLSALHLYREQLGPLHPEIQRFAANLANTAARRWTEPDAGMWEMRGEPRHHVSSKVLCWVALDRGLKLASDLGEFAQPERWREERDKIREAVLNRGWSERRQAFVQTFDSEDLDAAALLMPIMGFLPATDPRMRSTIEAIARDLTEDGLVRRYQAHARDNPDGLRGEEGTFVICSFWLVSALAMADEHERAAALFNRICDDANDLGLMAEEVDTGTNELLGNFPQAFSHIGQITAAWQLDLAAARARGEEPPSFAIGDDHGHGHGDGGGWRGLLRRLPFR